MSRTTSGGSSAIWQHNEAPTRPRRRQRSRSLQQATRVDRRLDDNVLVVEDEEAARSMLALSLKLAGYNLHTASDGVEALGEMKQRRFDVVVTDYQMPGMDGLQFLSLCKILWPNTAIVMLSGDQSDEIADIALRGGAFTWLHKHYERAVLLQILRLAVQQSVHEPAHLATSHSANEAQGGWKPGQRPRFDLPGDTRHARR